MSKRNKFKQFMLALCAVLAGAGFIEQLAKIKQIKRDARKPIKLDKMMLTHHNDCVFWNTNHKKCDCYMNSLHKQNKELISLREELFNLKKEKQANEQKKEM